MAFQKKEQKVPVEKLQEEHLTGPADESIEQAAEKLKANKVVQVAQVHTWKR